MVGNGGIATELVYELENVQVVWAIKHNSINSTFIDAGAAEFFLDALANREEYSKHAVASCDEQMTFSRRKYTALPCTKDLKNDYAQGSALGPDWMNELELKGKRGKKRKDGEDAGRKFEHVEIEYGCEVKEIVENDGLGEFGEALGE